MTALKPLSIRNGRKLGAGTRIFLIFYCILIMIEFIFSKAN